MTYDALQALGDPTRRMIFERLRGGPLPVGKLAAGLPVSRPAVSQHLRVLKQARLVREERQGTRNIYSVAPEGLESLRAYVDGFWGGVTYGSVDAGPPRLEPDSAAAVSRPVRSRHRV